MKKSSHKHKSVFSEIDYNSGEGMLTSVWGPMLWNFLHVMSFNYPVHPDLETKHHYRDFILSLKNVLPCKYCRINLTKNFKKLPLTMDRMKNRESFSRYLYELHELINQMLNKKSNLSYEDIRDRFETFRSKCVKSPSKSKSRKKSCKKSRKKSHSGCVEPFYGKKSKCIIKIVPQDTNEDSFKIHRSCKLKKFK